MGPGTAIRSRLAFGFSVGVDVMVGVLVGVRLGRGVSVMVGVRVTVGDGVRVDEGVRVRVCVATGEGLPVSDDEVPVSGRLVCAERVGETVKDGVPVKGGTVGLANCPRKLQPASNPKTSNKIRQRSRCKVIDRRFCCILISDNACRALDQSWSQ